MPIFQNTFTFAYSAASRLYLEFKSVAVSLFAKDFSDELSDILNVAWKENVGVFRVSRKSSEMEKPEKGKNFRTHFFF